MSLRDQLNNILSRIEDAGFNSSMFDGNSQSLIARIRQDAANISDVNFINAEATATSDAQAAPEVVSAPAAPAVDTAPAAASEPAPVTPGV